MSDSMDEEFERGGGGVSLTREMIPNADPQHAFGPGRVVPNSSSAAFGPLTPVATWARKRGRGSIGTRGQEGKAGEMQQEWARGNGGMPSGSQARGFASGRQSRHAGGNPISHHVGIVRGRESPDSEMSSASGSSDVSINGGIKRMRLDEQQQHQQHHFQQPTSAFDPYFSSSSKADSRQSGQGWCGSADVGTGGGMHDARPQHRSEQHRQGGRLLEGERRGLESGLVFGHHVGSAIPQQGGHDGSSRGPALMAGHDHNNHHPPAVSLDSVISGGQLRPSSDPILLPRSSSGSALLEGGFNHHLRLGSDGSGGGGVSRFDKAAALQTRSASFDTSGVPSFPPFAPQPPAQARYVRGIRVDANAPPDVDYSNVNHALKQLHMERRMAAEREAAAAAGGQAGGGVTGGNTIHSSNTGGGTGGAAWSGMRHF